MKCWHWWRNRKWWVRWIAYAAFLIISFYTVENIRGHRALEKAKAEYLAAGYRLDIDEILGPPIPDEENFAAAEVIYEEIEGLPRPDYERLAEYRRETGKNPVGIEILPFYFEGITDEKEVAEKLRTTLEPHRDVLSELATAAKRGGVSWSKFFSDPVGQQRVPSLSLLQALKLQIWCQLVEGDDPGTCLNITTQFKVGGHLTERSPLFHFLIGHTFTHTALRHIREGIEREIFDQTQLRELRKLAADQRFSQTDKLPFELEFAAIFNDFGEPNLSREIYSDLQQSSKNPIQLPDSIAGIEVQKLEALLNRIVWRIMPQGWHKKAIANVYDLARGKSIKDNSEFDRYLAENVIGNVATEILPTRIRKTEVHITLCKLAITLELHSLNHSTYPDPAEFELPSEHYGYQIGENGRPVLWYSPDAPVTEPLAPTDFDKIDPNYLWHYR